ncbi:PglL family O-oligosaccharyltransferase [Rhizobacter sp. OV335]|jgi:hypothetical protein|uniref:PglL family O-oligosaccharyltransferase n=1 Tax=Rhizobacter sp. OV335 TaxID=1500264 RepID=UPI00090F473D|nr:O-antigen ligase family protein [Rhizobacter sp. OV335]SHM81155.1 O-antigen ligase [Rhizobacter sp. OV335]
MHLLSWLALVFLGCAWLIPDHYLPWAAFQADAVAAVAMALLVAPVLVRAKRWCWPFLASVALACVGVIAVQAFTGLILFAGDAWMAGLYMAGFGLSLAAGATFESMGPRASPWEALWLTFVFAGVLSVGAELVQWLTVPDLGRWVTAMPPHGRPSGNLAQPNQLATLLSLGFVGTLALHQTGRLGGRCAWVVALWLVLGAVLTRSRTPWVAALMLTVWFVSFRARAEVRARPAPLLVLLMLGVAMHFAVNPVSDALHLSDGRPLAEQAQGGTRPTHWAGMLDAASRKPWVGYGWNQVAVAQSRVATDHASTWEQLEHSHNLLLDLLIWNGIPIGLGIFGSLAWWFASRWRRIRDPQSAYLIAAVGMVFLHSLLEFPLDYAYFLLPVGFMMGGLDERLRTTARGTTVPRWVAVGLWAGCCCLGVMIGRDYLEAEQNLRTFRLEAARIGTGYVTSTAPDLLLLTQQSAFLSFARHEAGPGMSAAELDDMHSIAQRFGYPPVLFRYAMASALNGRPEDARHSLELLCVTQTQQQCDEGRSAWIDTRDRRYPQLAAVSYPSTPALGARLTKP